MSRYKPGQIFTVKGGNKFQVRKGQCTTCHLENNYDPPCLKGRGYYCVALVGFDYYPKLIKSCGKQDKQ